MSNERPTCLIHISEEGVPYFYHNGDVDFIIVDERSPNDRVYLLTEQPPIDDIERIIGISDIGSQFDKRHDAIKHRIEAARSGKKHLEMVPKHD